MAPPVNTAPRPHSGGARRNRSPRQRPRSPGTGRAAQGRPTTPPTLPQRPAAGRLRTQRARAPRSRSPSGESVPGFHASKQMLRPSRASVALTTYGSGQPLKKHCGRGNVHLPPGRPSILAAPQARSCGKNLAGAFPHPDGNLQGRIPVRHRPRLSRPDRRGIPPSARHRPAFGASNPRDRTGDGCQRSPSATTRQTGQAARSPAPPGGKPARSAPGSRRIRPAGR